MNVERLLERLAKVKKTGSDKWISVCPGHADKSPSLSVREMSDGRVLIHCFAGCETEAILSAIGLTFRDIMPERLGDFPRARPAFTASDALRALAAESGVIAIMAARQGNGESLSEEDCSRACLAAGRIVAALEYVHGN